MSKTKCIGMFLSMFWSVLMYVLWGALTMSFGVSKHVLRILVSYKFHKYVKEYISI